MEDIDIDKEMLNHSNKFKVHRNSKKQYIMYGIGIITISIFISAFFLYFFKYRQEPTSISNLNQINTTELTNFNKAIFYDLDELIVNLNKANNHTNFLKIAVTFQLRKKEDSIKIENHLPLIKDAFQIYLRELKIEDLQGSAGVLLLKQDLLLRVNQILYPTIIDDVLFRDLLTQ